MDPPSFSLDSAFHHRNSRSSITSADDLNSKNQSNPVIRYEPPTPSHGRTSFSRASLGLDSYSLVSNVPSHRQSLAGAGDDLTTAGSFSRAQPRRTQTDPTSPLLDPFVYQLDHGESAPSSASDASSPGLVHSPVMDPAVSSSDSLPNLVRRSPILPEAQLHGSPPKKSSPGKSHSRKVAPGHIKRPRNAFILFRSHAVLQGLVPKDVEKDHGNISRIISHMWKSLSEEERQVWDAEAEKEKAEHRRLYPDYKYKPLPPGKKKTITKTTEIDSTKAEKDFEEIADSILKAHGHSGVIRSGEGKPVLSRTASKRNAIAEKGANKKPKPSRSRTLNGSSGAERSNGRSVRGVNTESPSKAILSAGDLATSVPQDFYAPGELLWNRTSLSRAAGKPSSEGAYSPPAFQFSTQDDHFEVSGVPSRPQTSHEANSGSLFGGWSERLREAALNSPSEPQPGITSSQSSSSMVGSQPSTSMSQTSRRKDRPQAFNLESLSAVTSITPLSPTSIPPELHGSASSMPNFSQTTPVHPRPETSGGLVTPRAGTFYNLRPRASANERMLISPLRGSFGDIRKLSASWSRWDKQLEASSIPIPTRIRYSQVGLHGDPFHSDLSQSLPEESTFQAQHGLFDNRDENSEDALFAQAAQQAAVNLHADRLLSDSEIDVFSFRPEFLNDGDFEGDEGDVNRVMTSQSSTHQQRPDTALSDGPTLRFDPSALDWNMMQVQNQNQNLPQAEINGGDRRRTIDGIKNALGAAAVQAAEKVRKDSPSAGGENGPLNTNEISQQLIRRWRTSFSMNSGVGSALQPSPSSNLSSLPEMTSEFPTSQARSTSVSDQAFNHSNSVPSYHIDDTLMFDSIPPSGSYTHQHQHQHQHQQLPEGQALAPRRSIDLFSPLDLDRTIDIPPVQWNLYGLQAPQTPIDMTLLDAAFTELENEGF